MPTDLPKKWLKVTITCPEKISEAVADQIGVMSGAGVDIQPLPSSDKQKITGFFPLEPTADEAGLEEMAAETLQEITTELEKLFAIYNLILHEPVSELIDDQDWATSWQQFFTAVEIVPGLVIKPSWEDYTATSKEYIITLDPGMAFGTGQHPSTRMALGLVASCYDQTKGSPNRVLDIGTGTGILAMASAAFGADQVLAIDNDPEAVAIAKVNVHTNHMDWNIGVSNRSLEDLPGPYDLICANIVHDVLVDMAPEICRLAADGGRIILAGILAGDQETNIEQVYRENGMDLLGAEHEEEWAALLLQKGS